MQQLRSYRMFFIALCIALLFVAVKLVLHYYSLEPVEQTSLHNAVISSAIFVMGFMLSAVIADYKESERIPAEFAANIEDMYNDAKELHIDYPKFDLDHFRKSLYEVLVSFRSGTRKNRKEIRLELADLMQTFGEMERAGVPPNFVTKLKQQQSQLLRYLFRVNYIQRIRFIPSAYVLLRAIVAIVLGLMLLTNVDPYYGGLVLTGAISFIMVYLLMLIHVISVPFQEKGKTTDDVSLFLIREARQFLEDEAPVKARRRSTKKV